MENNFVLKGSICYSASKTKLATLEEGYLVCEGGKSSGVFASLPEKFKHLPLHDYGDKLLIPGLVDLHLHAPQFTFRGLGMDLELLDWLNTHTFPEEAKYHDIAYAEKAYATFVEDLKKGPNTRSCIFATAHVPATIRLMEMLEDAGLISMVGKVNMDRNSHPDLQESSAQQSADDTLQWIETIAGKFKNTTPILTPRFIPSCTDELMHKIKEIQMQHALPVQSHLSENQGEIAWVQALCPSSTSYSDAYQQFGLFGGADTPTIMAHCIWCTPEEIQLIQKNEVYVAHCPQSNMNLSSGIAPVRRYMEKEIHVGLGSDVAGGCHSSIFRAMSDAIQASKLHWRLVNQNEPALTVEEAFYLGTLGGGEFFGKVGSFEAGYELDVVVLDDALLAAPYPLSIEDRLARAIYLSDDRHVAAKYVRGVKLF